jgi:hypothetical protein
MSIEFKYVNSNKIKSPAALIGDAEKFSFDQITDQKVHSQSIWFRDYKNPAEILGKLSIRCQFIYNTVSLVSDIISNVESRLIKIYELLI